MLSAIPSYHAIADSFFRSFHLSLLTPDYSKEGRTLPRGAGLSRGRATKPTSFLFQLPSGQVTIINCRMRMRTGISTFTLFCFYCNSIRRYLPTVAPFQFHFSRYLDHNNLVGGGLLLLVVPNVDVPLWAICTSSAVSKLHRQVSCFGGRGLNLIVSWLQVTHRKQGR